VSGAQRIKKQEGATVREPMPEAAPCYVEPPCAAASAVFKRRGRWYARVACPSCAAPLRVKLSLGPMVAHCDTCAADVEADVTLVVSAGSA
jgi:hypothetical protein